MRKGKRDGVVGYENNVYRLYRYKGCSPWTCSLATAKMISVEPRSSRSSATDEPMTFSTRKYDWECCSRKNTYASCELLRYEFY